MRKQEAISWQGNEQPLITIVTLRSDTISVFYRSNQAATGNGKITSRLREKV